MSSKSDPQITSNSRAEDYTKITFFPDFERFNMQNIDDDFAALVKKRVHDLAGCVRGVKVFLNDTRIKIKNFQEYVSLYLQSPDSKPIIYEKVNEFWEIAFAPSEGQFNQVSLFLSVGFFRQFYLYC